jgi:hypothetical protein
MGVVILSNIEVVMNEMERRYAVENSQVALKFKA